MKYCLGKKPAREGVRLNLRDYLDLSKLPTPPENFGHEMLVEDWEGLGNDVCGNCAIAGPYHAIMLWNKEAGRDVNVDTARAIQTYSELTKYDPRATNRYTGKNPTDHGCDVLDVAEHWRTKGLTDSDGNVHKIDCYVALERGNVEELWKAMYLFDGVGIGVSFPLDWMDEFNAGQIWDVVTHPEMEGGHYVLGVGRRGGYLNVVTWGRTQLITPAAYEQFNDETLIYLDEEKLVKGKDIDGFDLDQLKADMLELVSKPVPVEPSSELVPVG